MKNVKRRYGFTATVSDLVKTARYFLGHYPRESLLVFLASIVVTLLELIGASMILPFFAVSSNVEIDNPLLKKIIAMFDAFGLQVEIYPIFIIFISAFILKVILQTLTSIYIDYSRVGIERDLLRRVVTGLNAISWAYLIAKPRGLITNLLSREVQLISSTFISIQKALIAFLFLITYLVLGVAVSIQLALAAILMVVAALLVGQPLLSMARRAGAGQVDHMRELTTNVLQGIQALKVFKAMAKENMLFNRFSEANEQYLRANQMQARATQFLNGAQQLILAAGAIVGVYVGHEIFKMSMIEIGFIGIIMLRLNTNLAQVLKRVQDISNRRHVLEKFEEISGEIETNAEIRTGKSSPKLPAEITFRNVSFRHGSTAILKEINLTIPKTGMTTIIGPSGSGKTTLIDLLCGFHEPSGGSIFIGEDKLSDIDMRLWRQHLGYVTQEPNLVNTSIAENVAAFDPALTKADIEQALRLAGVLKTVRQLPNGIETVIGEGGERLSGGERQRVAIARAIASKPAVLILDEPTAAVDPETESDLVATLRELSKKMPIITISHQPAIAAAADLVYELKKGQVVSSRTA